MSKEKDNKPSKPAPETKPDKPVREGKFNENTLPSFQNPPPPPPPKEKK
jgi:hypothetical protein